jgi:hypothetical protein
MKRASLLTLGSLLLGAGLWVVNLSWNQETESPRSFFRRHAKDPSSPPPTFQSKLQSPGVQERATFESLVKQFQSVKMTDKEFNALPAEMKHHPAGQVKEVITALAEVYGFAAQHPEQKKAAEAFYTECVKDPIHSVFIRRMCEAHGASLFENWQATSFSELARK